MAFPDRSRERGPARSLDEKTDLRCMPNVHTIGPADYQWDEVKRTANLVKHGVDFADAVGALEDPASLTLEDGDAQGEPRYVTLGMGFTGRVLLVVWTERLPDSIRIISARRASPAETRAYRES